jgi:RNA polymerase sigma-70 factor (ECF subfamily)
MSSASVSTVGNEMPDGELARRIAAADISAFRLLMRRYNQKLYRTARSILKDDAEAEDAVQEAWLLAYRAMDGFRGESMLATWLVRIVVNESIGRMRKRSRRAEVIPLNGWAEDIGAAAETSMSESSPEQPQQAALRAELRRLIEANIDRLPDAFRTVFVLRALEELTVEEAAECLGIPEATVRTRYFRARALMREALGNEIDFSFEQAFAFAGARCDRIVEGVLTRLDVSQAGDA